MAAPADGVLPLLLDARVRIHVHQREAPGVIGHRVHDDRRVGARRAVCKLALAVSFVEIVLLVDQLECALPKVIMAHDVGASLFSWIGYADCHIEGHALAVSVPMVETDNPGVNRFGLRL